MKPAEAIKEGNEGVINLDNIPVRKYVVGDVVRKVNVLDIFDKKGSAPRLSLETYKVDRYERDHVIVVAKNGKEIETIENMIVSAVEVAEDERNKDAKAAKETRTRVVNQRAVRLNRKEIDVNHEGKIDADGNVTLKERMKPATEKRVRKAPTALRSL